MWTADPSFNYQWQKNGVSITGANASNYEVPFTAVPGDQFRRVVIATNGGDSATAAGASVTVPGYDGDAAGYFTRVQNAGGAGSFDLTARHADFTENYTKAVWNTFFLDLKDDGIWPAIRDLSVFCGVANLNGAIIKPKSTLSRANVITGLTASDYVSAGNGTSFAAGIRKSGNTGSFINPQVTFEEAGISPTNGHIFTYMGSDEYSPYNYFSDFPAGAETLATRMSEDRVFNSGTGLHDTVSFSPAGRGLFGMLFASTGARAHSYGSVRGLPSTVPSFTVDNPINYLRAKQLGVTRYGTCRLALVSLGSTMNEEQAWNYFQAIDRFMKRFKIVAERPEAVFLGDSGTHSYGLADSANTRFPRLVAEHYGMRETNLGVLTTRFMTEYLTYVRQGRSWGPDALKYFRNNTGKIFTSFGANDFNDNKGKTGDAYLAFERGFMNAYSGFLNNFKENGINSADLVVSNVAWNPADVGEDSARINGLVRFNREMQKMTLSQGAVYADVFTPTYAKKNPVGLEEFISDRRHANVRGMRTRADAIIEAVSFDQFLVSAVSRKTHGPAGQIDLDVRRGGVEPRFPGSNGAHTLIFTFAGNVTSASVSLVSAKSENAAISGSPVIIGNTVRINLVNIIDEDQVILDFTSITAAGGATYKGPFLLRTLFGDIDGSGTVDAADHALIRQGLGQPAAGIRARADLNLSGLVDSVDGTFVLRANGNTTNP